MIARGKGGGAVGEKDEGAKRKWAVTKQSQGSEESIGSIANNTVITTDGGGPLGYWKR